MANPHLGKTERTPLPATPLGDETVQKLRRAQADILEEYTHSGHNDPWIIGFSGGKDSTLVLQLVLETVLSLPPSERTRPIHVVTNDTLVESPVLISFIHKVLSKLEKCIDALRIPLVVKITTPSSHKASGLI